MKTGRPAAIRSRPLGGWGSEPSQAQARAVRGLLLEQVAGAADDADSLTTWADYIAELFSNYTCATAARAQRVGASLELADLRAIADDAEAVAKAGDAAPRSLLARLRRRLAMFPPFAEPAIAVADPGHLDRLDRVRAALARRAPPDAADLRTLAAACRACPAPPRFTKRSRAPADELQRGLAAMAAALPLLDPSATGRRVFVEEMTAALELPRSTFRPG